MAVQPEEDFYSDNDHESDHPDEKWLISYSDMMTLLFGFFVMMYVLSTSNKAKMEETLQKISKEGFSSEVTQTNEAPKPTVTNMEKSNAATDDILIELKKRKEEKNKKERELEDSLIQAKAEMIRSDQELKVALEKIKRLEETEIVFNKEKDTFVEKIKELEKVASEKSELNTTKTKDIEQLKKIEEKSHGT